jgi:hypothetical protein
MKHLRNLAIVGTAAMLMPVDWDTKMWSLQMVVPLYFMVYLLEETFKQ